MAAKWLRFILFRLSRPLPPPCHSFFPLSSPPLPLCQPLRNTPTTRVLSPGFPACSEDARFPLDALPAKDEIARARKKIEEIGVREEEQEKRKGEGKETEEEEESQRDKKKQPNVRKRDPRKKERTRTSKSHKDS